MSHKIPITQIVIEVQPTWREFLRLNFAVALPRMMRWIFGMILAVVAIQLLCAWYLNWPLDRFVRANAGFLLLPVGMAAYLTLLYAAARMRWNSASELRERKRFEFSDTGIKIDGESSSGTTAWQNIIEARTCKDLMLLRTSQRSFLIVPTRAFDRPEVLSAFRDHVRSRVMQAKNL